MEERSLSEKDWSETDVGTRLSLDLAKVDETRRQKVAVEPKAAEPAAPPPAPAPAPRVAYVPEVKKVKAAVFQGQGASAEMRLSSAGADLAGKEKVHYSDAKAKKDLADLEKQDKLAKAAAKGCAPLKKKEVGAHLPSMPALFMSSCRAGKDCNRTHWPFFFFLVSSGEGDVR